MTEQSETSLRDSLAAGLDAAVAPDAPPSTPEAGAIPDGPPGGGPPIPAELPPLEAPNVWGKKYKETFSQVASNAEQRAIAEAWLEQWKETQGYVTKKEQEAADYRKRFDPLHEVLSPYENYWRMQGMDTVSGVRQLVTYAAELARNPAQMLPQLAQMYGVDLRQLVAEQPYVDPQVQTLQQQRQQLQGQLQQQTTAQQQQYYNRLTEEVRAFETATDEQGNPKHPHFSRVFDRMVALARGGAAQSIDQAYEMAVMLDKELQAELSKEAQMREAAARAAAAKKAQEASKTVKAKATGVGDPPAKSLRDDLAERLAASGLS